MKSFVINLARRRDKLAEFRKRCPIDTFEVFPGIDGLLLYSYRNRHPDVFRDVKPWTMLKYGYVGASLSHYLVWRIVAGQAENVLIFEDDAYFSEDFTDRLELLEKQLGNFGDFGCCYLAGTTVPAFVPKTPELWKQLDDQIFERPVTASEDQWSDWVRTSDAYILSPDGAQALISSPDFLLSTASDVKLCEPLAGYRALDCFPHLCWAPPRLSSDVGRRPERRFITLNHAFYPINRYLHTSKRWRTFMLRLNAINAG